MDSRIEIIPIKVDVDITPSENLDTIILKSIENCSEFINNGDILVIAQKIVSKSENRIVDLNSVVPSKLASDIARDHNKDPKIVELVLRESREILRLSNGIMIVETRHGFICANAGVDQSNASKTFNHAILLPQDPDYSARKIRNSIRLKTGKQIAVIITDTFGRPFREGQSNVAIGIAGISPLKSYVGSTDMYGKKLRVTEIAVADELSGSAELVMGKSEGIPIAIIRGYSFKPDENSSISSLLRDKERDLFR